MFLPEAMGWGKSRVDRGRLRHPVLADHPLAVPNSTVQIELAELELVTRAKVAIAKCAEDW